MVKQGRAGTAVASGTGRDNLEGFKVVLFGVVRESEHRAAQDKESLPPSLCRLLVDVLQRRCLHSARGPRENGWWAIVGGWVSGGWVCGGGGGGEVPCSALQVTCNRDTIAVDERSQDLHPPTQVTCTTRHSGAMTCDRLRGGLGAKRGPNGRSSREWGSGNAA
jgi:hypothetical protein